MSNKPLYVAFVWHMHQPYYKDLLTGEYVLPWVRLHALKDYYDMVALMDPYPQIKATFNLVPSLLLQIEDYAAGTAKDKFLEVTVKDPKDLTSAEKFFILKNFFLANWDTMVKPYPRYYDLLLKRGRFVSGADIARVAKHFTTHDWMDLQVWFNLIWFGLDYRENDPVIKELFAKGKNFTNEDKIAFLAKQKELIGKVIPKYKEARDRGQIEISTTPFYHPILPLLCDSNVARVSMPDIHLPHVRFRHPEDAETQVKRAVEYFEKLFGYKPVGMWPSEGSVSPDIIPIIADQGIKWIATDEGILARSLSSSTGMPNLASQEILKPYVIQKDGKQINIVFRNHFLSDRVGFVYSRWSGEDAAKDLIHHLHNIRQSLPQSDQPYLVSIILDGENAWEYFPDGAKSFFNNLYCMLSQDPLLKTTTVNDFMEQFPPQAYLPKLFPGSWINNNFRIWIGHEEDNKAWDYLLNARSLLEGAVVDEEKLKTAWEELYIAEGSDWCWWYGDDHSSENDDTFDALFRKHLKNIYTLIGQPAPNYLDLPIKQLKVVAPIKEPTYLIQPIIDGEVSNFFEWLAAGVFDIEKAKGAMHQSQTILKKIYYGFDLANFYLRLDASFDLGIEEAHGLSYAVTIFAKDKYQIQVKFNSSLQKYEAEFMRVTPEGTTEKISNLETFAIKKVIEIGFPFALLEVEPDQEVQFSVSVMRMDQELEVWPKGGVIAFNVPTENFEAEHWFV
ncbi:MAG: glycoside hydrolase family 57 protein [Candidatus Saganbacteria bacterium]|nr:glycoside hydrolase family 57 protein [Candidatus Saganbacteria bacterium]